MPYEVDPVSEEPLHQLDFPFCGSHKPDPLSIDFGQVSTKVDPDKVTSVGRTVRDVVLPEECRGAPVRLAETSLVQGEVRRQPDRIKQQVGPQDVLCSTMDVRRVSCTSLQGGAGSGHALMH